MKSESKNTSTQQRKYFTWINTCLYVLLTSILIVVLLGTYVFIFEANSKLQSKFAYLCDLSDGQHFAPDANETLLIRQQIKEFGYNKWLSERTCLNRTMPDLRHKDCSNSVLPDLPQVSIIMTYHHIDESVLLRALHSIKAQTSAELLKELILIDDASDLPDLSSRDFRRHVYNIFREKLRVVRLEKFVGAWGARLEGARLATAEVLVFLEPYVEVGVGWLPALLAPIKANSRVSTVPLLNKIDHLTFRHKVGRARHLVFDWDLHEIRTKLRLDEVQHYPAPFGTPILTGEVLAIGREWFWHLGAYQNEYYNPFAVQLELSLKLWLCGGKVVQVPCSHIGLLQRQPSGLTPENLELTSWMDKCMSFKNLLETWFDEYKSVVYNEKEELTHLNADNLRAQNVLRRRLECKPAAYFFKHVAPEIVQQNPIELIKDYANGELSMFAEPFLCLSTEPIKNMAATLRLRACKLRSLRRIASSQYWALTANRDLSQNDKCLEAHRRMPSDKVLLRSCNYASSIQYWFYNYDKRRLEYGELGQQRRCLEAVPHEYRVVLNDCVENNPMQQWSFTAVNTADLDLYAQELQNGTFSSK